MARRPKKARRTRFFVGCEGESEQGYAALLRYFADSLSRNVHLDTKVISNAGDPLALVNKSVATIAKGEAGSKPPYVEKFLLMDTDWFANVPGQEREVERLAAKENLILVKQVCCFEAFLLRHFPGHENDNPHDATASLRQLRGVWSSYKKGTPASELQKHLTIDAVRNAARTPLNGDYQKLLVAIGLL